MPRRLRPSHGGAGVTWTSRARLPADDWRKSAISEPEGAGTRKRRAIRTCRTWSEITLLASARVAPSRASARRYPATEPPKDDAITVRCASARSLLVTGNCWRSTTWAYIEVSATSRSPVTRVAADTPLARTFPQGVLHCTPRGKRSWPTVRSVLNLGPAIAGPLQSAGFRVQSQTHAAAGFSGSRAPWFHSPQPPDP